MHPAGLRLRQAREKLGLTYREVERASVEIAAKRGRPDFILHISRLADIENLSFERFRDQRMVRSTLSTNISRWCVLPFPAYVSG